MCVYICGCVCLQINILNVMSTEDQMLMYVHSLKKSKLYYLYYVRKENYVITHGFSRLFNLKLSLATQELIHKRLSFNLVNKPTRLTSSDTKIHHFGVIIYLR